MKIWRLTTGESNTTMYPIDEEKNNFTHFKGDFKENWEITKFSCEKKGKHRDYAYYIGGLPIFSKKVVDLVGDLIKNDVQLLNIEVDNLEIDYKLINVTSVIDAVDYSRSIPQRTITGSIFDYTKFYLLEEKVKDKIVFKIPEFIDTRVYVNDSFRETILKAKLKGFEFEEVWDSEWTEEKEQEQQMRYDTLLNELSNIGGEKCNWSEAMSLLANGKVLVSGEWKIELNSNRELQIFKLGLDCQYFLIDAYFIPPILLELKWSEYKL